MRLLTELVMEALGTLQMHLSDVMVFHRWTI